MKQEIKTTQTDSKEGLHTQGEAALLSLLNILDGGFDVTVKSKSQAHTDFETLKNEIKALLYSHRELFDIVKGLSVIFYKELQTKKMPDGITEMYPLIKAAVNNAKNI